MVLRPYGLQTVRGPEQASSRGTQMAHRCSSLCTVNLFEGDRGGQGQEGEAGQEVGQEGQVDPPDATSSDGLWTKHQGPSLLLPTAPDLARTDGTELGLRDPWRTCLQVLVRADTMARSWRPEVGGPPQAAT